MYNLKNINFSEVSIAKREGHLLHHFLSLLVGRSVHTWSLQASGALTSPSQGRLRPLSLPGLLLSGSDFWWLFFFLLLFLFPCMVFFFFFSFYSSCLIDNVPISIFLIILKSINSIIWNVRNLAHIFKPISKVKFLFFTWLHLWFLNITFAAPFPKPVILGSHLLTLCVIGGCNAPALPSHFLPALSLHPSSLSFCKACGIYSVL